jgi:hypothetical protein
VHWPGGKVQTLVDLAPGKLYKVEEPK